MIYPRLGSSMYYIHRMYVHLSPFELSLKAGFTDLGTRASFEDNIPSTTNNTAQLQGLIVKILRSSVSIKLNLH